MAKPLKEPIIAALLSLVVTGLGQAYNRQPGKAILFAFLPNGVPLLLSWAGGWQTFARLATILAAVLAFDLFVISDAWRVARRGEKPTASRPLLFLAYGLLICLFVAQLVAMGNVGYLSRLVRVPAFRVASSSMTPTILKGERIMVDTRAFRQQSPQRGDLVVVELEGRGLFVRRVVALPGDVVSGNGQEILVNEKSLPAPYWREELPWLSGPVLASLVDFEPITISPGELYGLGDDYLRSIEPHNPRGNLVSMEQIKGKPLYIYWSEDTSRIGRSLQ